MNETFHVLGAAQLGARCEQRRRRRRDAISKCRFERLPRGQAPDHASQKAVSRAHDTYRRDRQCLCTQGEVPADQQRALFADFAPDGLKLDDLRVRGPVFVLKLKWVPKALRRRMVAELWLYPDNSTLLELSTKCLPNEAFDVAAATRGYLVERGLDVSGEQQTKTRKALAMLR